MMKRNIYKTAPAGCLMNLVGKPNGGMTQVTLDQESQLLSACIDPLTWANLSIDDQGKLMRETI